ncbi:MAG TPA: chromosome segregation protein SMC [Acidimicrobiales bacterium]|nr:chromosome segregation protein SMC [Acidimicrobiales bacterium]
MFLKSLTIKGFKSFADPTTLEFEPGVTVVVGPNGSGKSNVVDAVAWVLGAQGPRTVRSAKMEDVIFAGTPKRAALGRAEVSLTIDNSAGLLPIEFSEVTITRTLFRTGDSEYAINRVPCRLLDVQELLSDTGVGRQQHVIISQGNLDAILNSRAEDRRLVIEEAAGVLKHRRRKEKAERRLESTEGSLLRLQDLLREVRRQIRPLEKQAEAARRHDDVVAELQALRRHLAGRELTSIEARLGASARTRGELAHAEEELRAALSRFDTDVLAAEAELGATQERGAATDLADAVSKAEGLRARAGGLVALIAQRQRGIERELAVSVDQDVVASLEAEAASLSRQLEEIEAEGGQLLSQELEVVEAESVLAAESAEVDERWRDGGETVTDPAAEVRGELGAVRGSVERGVAEQRRVESRRRDADGRATRLTAEVERLTAAAAAADEAAPGLAEAAKQAIAAQSEAERAHADAEAARRQADALRHRWEARAEALAQAMDEARARAGAERLEDVDGVLGALLELVEVEAGYEAAFEAAAGEALAAVVVDGLGTARQAIEHLRAGQMGGAVVALPDPVATTAGAAPVELGDWAPAQAVTLRAKVSARLPGGRALLDQLLARAVCVPTWNDAVTVAEQRPDLVVVTPDGDRCAGGIWRTGAGAAGTTGAALDAAREEAQRAAEAATRAAEELRRATSALEAARAAATEAARAVDGAASRRRANADALQRAKRDLIDATSDAEAAATQQQELADRLAGEQRRLAELEALLPELEAEAARHAERALAERAARSRIAERAAAVASLRRDFEVRAAGVEERRSLVTRRLSEVESRLARNVAERDEAAARRQRLAVDAEVTARLGALVGGHETALAAAAARLRQRRRAETEATRAVTDRLDQLRRQRAAAERQLAELRERASRVELDDAEAKVRLETLTDAVRRELDCEPEAVRGAECPELPPGTSPASRRTELERDLRLMGPINPLALEELTALQERHTFLEGQLEDVRSARRELGKVIKAVDAEITDVFRAAYADVADNFEKLFGTLFPGGTGRLRLTDPDHLLETGIEVEARPSGKNVRRLSLLSGGERSLVAMAFLFAVFRARPSPFYLMDEVEAALDDVNLHRFLDLVKEFREEAQLLIVSHQQRTMEAADCLYGVTMAPGGSSRVVSERIEDGRRIAGESVTSGGAGTAGAPAGERLSVP